MEECSLTRGGRAAQGSGQQPTIHWRRGHEGGGVGGGEGRSWERAGGYCCRTGDCCISRAEWEAGIILSFDIINSDSPNVGECCLCSSLLQHTTITATHIVMGTFSSFSEKVCSHTSHTHCHFSHTFSQKQKATGARTYLGRTARASPFHSASSRVSSCCSAAAAASQVRANAPFTSQGLS